MVPIPIARNLADPPERNPLWNAIRIENIPCIELLIEYGADINEWVPSNGGILYGTIALGKIKVLSLILQQGADVNSPAES